MPAAGGLPAAIRQLADEFQQLTGVPCALDVTEVAESLDPFRAQMLLRIVQEALNNAVKHGKPHHLQVSMLLVNGMLHICVADDGVGLSGKFDTEAGSGLRTMKLRAELIGGQLTLRVNGSAGCVLECILPLAVSRSGTPFN
jgi:signal transduction histidine kinase